MFKGEVAQLEAWQAETTLTQESARSKARRGSWSAFEAQLAPAKPSFCGLHKHISKRGGSWLYKRVAQTLHSSGQQLCKRQWLPEKQHGWLSTSHRSDLPSPLLFLWRSIDFFTFPALHRLDLILRLQFFTEIIWNLPRLIEALHLWRDGFLGHPPKHTHIGIILRLELNVLTLHWYQVEKICTADDTVGTDGTVRTAALQSLMCAFGSPLPVFALFFFFFPSPSLATHLRWRRPSASSFCSAATWWWISL